MANWPKLLKNIINPLPLRFFLSKTKKERKGEKRKDRFPQSLHEKSKNLLKITDWKSKRFTDEYRPRDPKLNINTFNPITEWKNNARMN